MNAITQPNGPAPAVSRKGFRLGAKGGKVSQAWQFVWDRLDTKDYRDAGTLSREAAEKFGLKPDSVRACLYMARTHGLLESIKTRGDAVTTERGGQPFIVRPQVTHYRIKSQS